jgi:hypothetical protein
VGGATVSVPGDDTVPIADRGGTAVAHRSTDAPTWPCATCGDERVFEQPPCVDGHTDDGGECPEWACTDCGTALLVGGDAVEVTKALRQAA